MQIKLRFTRLTIWGHLEQRVTQNTWVLFLFILTDADVSTTRVQTGVLKVSWVKVCQQFLRPETALVWGFYFIFFCAVVFKCQLSLLASTVSDSRGGATSCLNVQHGGANVLKSLSIFHIWLIIFQLRDPLGQLVFLTSTVALTWLAVHMATSAFLLNYACNRLLEMNF